MKGCYLETRVIEECIELYILLASMLVLNEIMM